MKHLVNKFISGKLFRYLITGGLSFIAEYGSFILLVYALSMSTWLAQAFSYCVGLGVNFMLLSLWVFRVSNEDTKQHAIKYLALVAFNLPATSLLMGVLTDNGIEPFVSKIIVVASAALWNYIIYDKLIFKQKLSPEDVL